MASEPDYSANNNASSSSSAPAGSMNWEPVQQRLLDPDLNVAWQAAKELRDNVEVAHSTEYPLLLSALSPAFSSILTQRTKPNRDTNSVEHKLRHAILDAVSKFPSNEVLRPHAPHLVAIALEVLNRDYEANALLSLRIIFDLYKTYRSLPQDYVQPFLDFVVSTYRALPRAVQHNFAWEHLNFKATETSKTATTTIISTPITSTATPTTTATTATIAAAEPIEEKDQDGDLTMQDIEVPATGPEVKSSTPASSVPSGSASVDSLGSAIPGHPNSPEARLPVRSNLSFRVLTECPLIVMLMLQLYPKFLKTNIAALIVVMMEALAIRSPSLSSITPPEIASTDSPVKRSYHTRVRELAAAQAKTLSFLTFLLRSFQAELKPYEDRLASHVVALIKSCPRESTSTRKELLVATRHLLSSDFRKGFFRHADVLMDERLLLGSHYRSADQASLRPLGYQTVSELVLNVRSSLTMLQMSKVVSLFSRVLHDEGSTCPMPTQYLAVRTLLNLGDVIYHNTDLNPQLGRDLLVRILNTLTEKLTALNEYYPEVQRAELKRGEIVSPTVQTTSCHDSVRDLQSMIRAIIVGNKNIVFFLSNYRNQRDKEKVRETLVPPPGSNEEVSSAYHKLTHTEVAILDRYIIASLPALKLLKMTSTGQSRVGGEKTLADHHRDTLTYFAATFAALDGYNFRRTIGRRLNLLVDAIVEDPLVMIVPRHLLAVNAGTSYEFCSMLTCYLVERLDDLALPRRNNIVFLKPSCGQAENGKDVVLEQLREISQNPRDSEKHQRQRSSTYLQLFERALKSLAPYPENESTIRRYLRFVVSECLRSSLETSELWPDNYCILLRYIFRSISAGKFEESYKELLPLIPTVLNGLYRVICTADDTMLRRTAMELCLTIPARLSSLLPHMNLLVRVIIPALDSNSGDLVNLGLRTLEFWVDNLNPLFLYPEMSKDIPLLSAIMRSLSRHLRPAPYPYGLLTLRLLGKLGGKNRHFLREPLHLTNTSNFNTEAVEVDCSWIVGDENSVKPLKTTTTIALPLDRCIEMLKTIATSQEFVELKICVEDEPTALKQTVIPWGEYEVLWSTHLENVDFEAYSKGVSNETRRSQAHACLSIIKTALGVLETSRKQHEQKDAAKARDLLSSFESYDENVTPGRLVALALMFARMIDSTKQESQNLLISAVGKLPPADLSDALADFLSEPILGTNTIAIEISTYFLKSERSLENSDVVTFVEHLVRRLCGTCCSATWSRQRGAQLILLFLVTELGHEWALEHELTLINAAIISVKSVPRELSTASIKAVEFFVRICEGVYGKLNRAQILQQGLMWDILSDDDNRILQYTRDSVVTLGDDDAIDQIVKSDNLSQTTEAPSDSTEIPSTRKKGSEEKTRLTRPSEEVFRVMIRELISAQHAVRFVARFITSLYIVPHWREGNDQRDEAEHPTFIRRAVLSKSMKLLPLPYQVGAIEGLASVVKLFPGVLPLDDQHFLGFLSELLKMTSVPEGDMQDPSWADSVVDKNGFAGVSSERLNIGNPTHASALFCRRECILNVDGMTLVVPAELPMGVQLRVSAIKLFHAVIVSYADAFFNADKSTPIGKIRSHAVSLLFRSLVSQPDRAAQAAYVALRDARIPKTAEVEQSRGHSCLSKDLIQTCIRPVLLNLRDFKRLSIPLLRGLSRLLSLLSSWFNKTLGEKLLDHLQKWTDPGNIMSSNIWSEGQEPHVAAAIVDIFALLPHASNFVEPLVKTCMKLDATLPAFKARYVESPYRGPLVRYLNKHPGFTVSFFFQRLRTPIYSELFHWLINADGSTDLRSYLSNKQCSVMILNVCFETPLAIMRSERTSPASGSRISLALHGIGQHSTASQNPGGTSARMMSTEALELQFQGFRIVESLMANDISYVKDHNDIVRAFRWLWRSKGRALRLQHEESLSPRFHDESKMLASFLLSYAKSFPNEDLDILFELVRVYIQPSGVDLTFISRYLEEMVSNVLTAEQKKRVLERFFDLVSREKNEEIKVLSIHFLLYPMILATHKEESRDSSLRLVDSTIVERFTKEVLFSQGAPFACGERLKVELLRLLDLIVEQTKSAIEPFRKDVVRFCWALIKNEDASCKGWAYVLICRLVESFETPKKIVNQIYSALLRSHQQDGKDLIRRAIDLLIPVLPKRLDEDDMRRAIDQASHLLFEDNSSTPQLAHICTMIVRSPDVFRPFRIRFIGQMINCLSRLGLPPNSSAENRPLTIDMVDLLWEWNSNVAESLPLISHEQMDVVGNFLVRLKIVSSEEKPDGRTAKFDAGLPSFDERLSCLLVKVLKQKGVDIRKQPFEKVMEKNLGDSGPVLASLDLFVLMLESGLHEFFTANEVLVEKLVLSAFSHAKTYEPLRKKLLFFTHASCSSTKLTSIVILCVEQIIIESTDTQKKRSPGKQPEASRQVHGRSSKDKEKDDATKIALAEFYRFGLELASELCRQSDSGLRRLTNVLLNLLAVLTKTHVLEAAAKQRQGGSSGPPTNTPGVLHHTPTKGILEETCDQFYGDQSRILGGGKTKGERENSERDDAVRSLVVTLGIFERSDVAFTFTQSRKNLFQILSSILDSSDNVQLLMVATRVIGKWLLSDDSGGPLTSKERNSFLWKIASFDSNGLSDDLTSQPLADLVAYFVQRVCFGVEGKLKDGEGLVIGRCMVACLLHAQEDVRIRLITSYVCGFPSELSSRGAAAMNRSVVDVFWRLLNSDIEGLASRYWTVFYVDCLISCLSTKDYHCLNALRVLAHGDTTTCQKLFEWLLPAIWDIIPSDAIRLRISTGMEFLLSRPFHAQFLKAATFTPGAERRCSNAVRSFLSGVAALAPAPVLEPYLLVSLAENYNCWFESISLLEKHFSLLGSTPKGLLSLDAMGHCYRRLGEDALCLTLAKEACTLPETAIAIGLNVYGMVSEAAKQYEGLVDSAGGREFKHVPTDFEMDLWEEHWIGLQRELCQLDIVSEFANSAGSLRLRLECAWKVQDWNTVRSLCTSTSLLAAVESGDPLVKISETLLAVADGKLSEVENLHAQTAQLCLHKWQLLPLLSSGSTSHTSLLHFFHRLVEIRESGQIMVETSTHSSEKTLPDLKNLLNAWRHRLPNDFDPIASWDEVFSWRAHMFSAITSNFHWSEPNTLATLHDRPWTAIRMAKTARKHGMRDVSLLTLNKTVDERAMNVSDAFLKLREQILAYYNPGSDAERHGGLNLINTTNLSFFDQPQKSEIFRLKASFLASLGFRSKANQAFCHALQISPTHARAWESWGGLCSMLGAVAEKQVDLSTSKGGQEGSKEVGTDSSKRVAQYLAQAMGCYLESIQLDTNEWTRIHLAKCIWMLTKDGGTPGVLCSTFENRAARLPPWVWLPWLPQLFTCLYRPEGRAIRTIFSRVLKSYPQAAYYPLRAFFLERRDVERTKSSSSTEPGQHNGSASYSEEMVSQLRRAHTSLWSSLEAILEELLMKFRPSHEEEFLATIVALLERAETQTATIGTKDEETVTASVWKTLGRIAVKYFRHSDSSSDRKDTRSIKTAEFKSQHRKSFEDDFHVSSSETVESDSSPPPMELIEILLLIKSWKAKVESHVMSTPRSVPLITSSPSLAMYCIGDAPDLWPGSCDSRYTSQIANDCKTGSAADEGNLLTSTTSSAAAAKKAALAAAKAVSICATREGVGSDYGGGSAHIEIPGLYMPNTTCWTDTRPSPELHPKLARFEPFVKVICRNDQLVRRIGMIGSDGKTYRYLLQCALPYWTRTDERTAQTYYALDKVLRKSMPSARAHLSAQPHPVVPVAQRLRLVHEPESRFSLDEVMGKSLREKISGEAPASWRFNEALKVALSNKDLATQKDEERSAFERSTRLEVFESFSKECDVDSQILSNYMSRKLQSPEPFFQFRRTFSNQWATNCLLQFVFHISERSPGKVVGIETDGRVLSPDFRIRYNNQGALEGQPVPYRMTPNIENLIGFPLMDGRFITSMAMMAGAIREYKEDMDPIFRLLMRDDLVAFFTKSMAKSDNKTQEMERQLVDRVSQNVATVQSRFSECSPKLRKDKKEGLVDQRVRELLDAAQSKDNICMMNGTFQGWV
jgi:hypothetical protein